MAPASRPGGTLALDPGDKRTGCAYADALGISLTPLPRYRGRVDSRALLDHIAELLSQRDVSRLLVGLPLHADGSESVRCEVSRALADRLRERFPQLEVELVDEHLTSKAAEELLREAGFRARESRALRDSWSALVLLADWLRSARYRET